MPDTSFLYQKSHKTFIRNWECESVLLINNILELLGKLWVELGRLGEPYQLDKLILFSSVLKNTKFIVLSIYPEFLSGKTIKYIFSQEKLLQKYYPMRLLSKICLTFSCTHKKSFQSNTLKGNLNDSALEIGQFHVKQHLQSDEIRTVQIQHHQIDLTNEIL